MLIGLPLKPTPASGGQNNRRPAAESLGTAWHQALRPSHEQPALAGSASRTVQTSVGVPGCRLMGAAPCKVRQLPCRRTED